MPHSQKEHARAVTARISIDRKEVTRAVSATIRDTVRKLGECTVRSVFSWSELYCREFRRSMLEVELRAIARQLGLDGDDRGARSHCMAILSDEIGMSTRHLQRLLKRDDFQ